MSRIVTLFWNKGQRRLRAGVRLLIQLTLFFILMKGLGALVGLPGEITPGLPLRVYLAVGGVRLLRVLGSVWLASRFLDRRPLSDLGLHLTARWWQDLAFGFALGAFLIGGVFLVELAAGWVTVTEYGYVSATAPSFLVAFMVFTFLFLCVGFSEELSSRGYHLTNIAEGLNWR